MRDIDKKGDQYYAFGIYAKYDNQIHGVDPNYNYSIGRRPIIGSYTTSTDYAIGAFDKIFNTNLINNMITHGVYLTKFEPGSSADDDFFLIGSLTCENIPIITIFYSLDNRDILISNAIDITKIMCEKILKSSLIEGYEVFLNARIDSYLLETGEITIN